MDVRECIGLIPCAGANSLNRYVAFISYSHKNRQETEWLHRALERYHLPKKLVGRTTSKGVVPARLIPIFRDRDELGAAADLGAELQLALENSGHLIVVASPAANQSQWVTEEIRRYKAMHGEDRVLALIVDGEPWASNQPGREAEEAFPRSLRFRLNPDGSISDIPAEPIAADIRPQGDGRRLALRKLTAGLTGLRLDDLVQREAQRRHRQMTMIAAGSLTGMVLASGLAVYAEFQRRSAVEQRQIAEKESAAARAATDYLIGTFELSNPATENPRTVSLVTILARGAERARTELKAQPEIEARLVDAVGRSYNNLGLLDEAERALARALPAIKRAGPDGAAAMVTLSDTYFKRGSLDQAASALNGAEQLLGSNQAENPAIRSRLAFYRGTIAYGRGEAEEALGHLDRALAYLRRVPNANPREEAVILDGRGRILVDLGRGEDAEASLQRANALIRQYYGEQHLWAGRSFYALALAAYNDGQTDEASARIERSLSILSRLLDQTNPYLADALSLKGSIDQAAGRFVAADRALAASIDAYRKVYGRPHYNIGIAEFYRAQVAMKLGDPNAALRYLEDGELNYRASYGDKHPNIGELMILRAAILNSVKRRAEARQECATGLAMLDDTMGPDANFTKGLREQCQALGLL